MKYIGFMIYDFGNDPEIVECEFIDGHNIEDISVIRDIWLETSREVCIESLESTYSNDPEELELAELLDSAMGLFGPIGINRFTTDLGMYVFLDETSDIYKSAVHLNFPDLITEQDRLNFFLKEYPDLAEELADCT